MKTANLAAETIREAFGKPAEDVLSPISGASDVCSWLAAISCAIKREAGLKYPNVSSICHLAEAAQYLACEFANDYDCQHEGMFDSLQQAGVIAAKADRHDY